MKKFFLFLGVLFILLIQFSSCIKDDDKKPVYYFYDEPVVVNEVGENPIIRNQSYLFKVPELAENKTLKKNDLLWTSFTVDLEDDPSNDLAKENKIYTARNFKYKTVDSTKVIIPANTDEFQTYLTDDYSDSIESAVLFKYYIDDLMFFGFQQKGGSSQKYYTYELVLNPELENSNYPTLYIRSKLVTPSPKEQASDKDNRTVFAFDAADFVVYYREYFASNPDTRFNLKYKTGVDSNGKDVYKEFMSNPIHWNFCK